MSKGREIWRTEVVWEDSQLVGGSWQPIDAILRLRKRVRCASVGYVLADDKHGIVLAASVNGGNATGITIIPARQIVRRRRLR